MDGATYTVSGKFSNDVKAAPLDLTFDRPAQRVQRTARLRDARRGPKRSFGARDQPRGNF